MHAWHDVYVDDHLDRVGLPGCHRRSDGQQEQRRAQQETALLKLDRVLYRAVHYPANCGVVPRTFCEEGHPLDARVLSQEAIFPLTIVEARAMLHPGDVTACQAAGGP